MMEPVISVIIPVYKVETYLHQCINSVIDQTYTNMEIILVDDGSNDDCPRICDNYAQQDSRIIVIHKANGGLSSARNAGIKAATGDYLVFLDSDDYWDDIAVMQDLVMQINEFESDVIIWGYKKLYQKTMREKESPLALERSLLFGKGKEDAFYILIANNCYTACAWNKLISRHLFDKNNLLFIEGIYSEDVEWCARLALCAKSFDVFDKVFYVYRQRVGSITKMVTEKNIVDLENCIASCLEIITPDASNQFGNSLYAYTSVQYANYLICLNNISGEFREIHFPFVKKQQYLLQYGFSARVKIIRFCSKAVGIKSTIALLGLAAKLKQR